MVVVSIAFSINNLPYRLDPLKSTQCSFEYEEMNTAVRDLLDDAIANVSLPCPCLNATQWKLVAYFNFSHQECPSTWSTNTEQVRGCVAAQTEAGCSSAYYSVGNYSYNRVCGRIVGYQKGSTDAFNFWYDHPNVVGLEDAYVDGASLTHGTPGFREHIWTFAAGYSESHHVPGALCDCTNTNVHWPHQVPSFIQNNYFCETGGTTAMVTGESTFYNDPLWDGEGCGPASTCCQKNNPPWFCVSLPQMTSDDLELRLCRDEERDIEDVIISFIELYIAVEEPA